MSRPKMGRPYVLPNQITVRLAAHSTVMQVSGEGKANKKIPVNVTGALVSGTTWKGKVSP